MITRNEKIKMINEKSGKGKILTSEKKLSVKKYFSLFTLLFSLTISAQTNLSTTENYIYTKTCLDADCIKKAEGVQYFDGLGRPVQAVAIKATPLGRDMVTPVEYDPTGKQVRDYLPIPQQGTSNGAFYTNPNDNAPSIYGSEKIYSEKIYDNVYTDRVKQVVSVGNAWTQKPVNLDYKTNTDGEVKKYTLITSWVDGRTDSGISVSGSYTANQLMKSSATDEDGNTTVEFQNGEGQTVLVRKNDGTHTVDTYYLYNEYGQLAYVIPPLAVNGTPDTATLDNLCYQYRYDGMGKLVEKKLPGKGWEYIVYDKQDRMVAVQDAVMRTKGQWLYTKYDQFGRVAFTGISSGGIRTLEQANAEAYGSNNVTRTSGAFFNREGMDVYYDPNGTYPTVGWVKLLSVNYYDTYPSYSFNPAVPATVLGQAIITDLQNTSVNTKALPTLSLVKNIEDDNWTKSYVYYDTNSRAVSTYSINHLGGYTKAESELDFAGVVKQTKMYHKRLSTDTEKVITQTFEYDPQNRLKKQWHQVDSQPQELISENSYNELSQLSNKKVGNNLQSIDYTYNIRGGITQLNDPANLNGKLFGYTVKYYNPINPSLSTGKYNGNVAEVSWRTASDQVLRRYSYQYDGLNRLKKGIYSEPDASVPQNELYNETIAYDMNSNITSLQRNTKGISGTAVLMDNLTYTYTGNRLNSVTDASANYNGYPDSSGNTMTYDDNGNMKDHKDKGILQMEYNFQNLVDKITFDQTYLARNLITGKTVSRNVTTNYTYTADGTKLRKVYKYGGQMFATEVSLTTDYLDGFQYESETASSPFILKFVPTAEGYYNFENNKYIYSYTDHLGNVRVSYTKTAAGSAEVLEENNFYPFGMKHEGYNVLSGNPAYNYQFGGKELQKETGWSDFGARMYMSDIGRWGVIDPLAEQYRRFTPYNYAVNNPIRFTDPDGRKLSGSDVEFTDNTIGSNSFWGLSGGRKKIVPFVGGQDFLGQMFDLLDAATKRIAEEGGGGKPAANVIINFIRGDKEGLGNFVNSDFAANGWHIIDALSLKDALTKLTSYLGNSQADNIYINAHGLLSERYVYDESGELIPDSSINGRNGYKVVGDFGFYTGNDQILGSSIQQYISDKSKLSQNTINSIDSFIGIANYVKSGKNLIMGSCYSAKHDDLFGTGISSIVQSRDTFVNRDLTSMHYSGSKGKEFITFHDFTNFNQTSRDNYVNGWVWYKNGEVTKQNFNIIMTKYGVKTIK